MSICEKEYRWLCARLTDRLSRTRHPLSGTIELTWACNFRCVHCYLKGPSPGPVQLDTLFALNLLDELADAGCLGLVLTGGEPLCHPDFRKIYSRAVRRGFLVTLFTNGSLIDESTADFLAAHPPRCVELSLYGSDEESYGWVTGTRGNFTRSVQGLDRLLRRGIPVLPKAMLLKALSTRIDDLRNLVSRRGLRIRLDPIIDLALNGDPDPLTQRMNPEEAVSIEMDDPERMDKLGPYDEMWRNIRPGTGSAACLAGFSSFHLDPQGRLMPCLQLRQPAISAHSLGFREAWERLGRHERPCYDESILCNLCDLTHLCGFCPGLMQLGEAPPRDGNGYHCRIARARARVIRKGKRGGRREVA